MHPNQFFNHVTMLNESFIPGGAQALLASAHPRNFLPVPVQLPVYRIKVRFQTGKGVYKTAENTQYCRPLTIIRNSSTSGSTCSWKTIRMRIKGI